jgi:hypothetical protein
LARYLTFANLAWVACLGLALECVRSWPLRVSLAALCLLLGVDGTAAQLPVLAQGTAAHREAVAWVREHLRARDVAVASGPGEAYLFRYYSRRIDRERVPVFCAADGALGLGPLSKVPALRASDPWWRSADPPRGIDRIWSFNDALPDAPGFVAVDTRAFEDAQHRCNVSLWARRASATLP